MTHTLRFNAFDTHKDSNKLMPQGDTNVVSKQSSNRKFNCYASNALLIGQHAGAYSSHGLASCRADELKLDGYEVRIDFKPLHKSRGVHRPHVVVITGKVLG